MCWDLTLLEWSIKIGCESNKLPSSLCLWSSTNSVEQSDFDTKRLITFSVHCPFTLHLLFAHTSIRYVSGHHLYRFVARKRFVYLLKWVRIMSWVVNERRAWSDTIHTDLTFLPRLNTLLPKQKPRLNSIHKPEMADSTSATYWKFQNLKGLKDYHTWAACIKALSIKEKTWEFVSGEEKRPVSDDSDPVKTGDADGSGKAIKMSEELKKGQKEWDDKNNNAWAMFRAKIDKQIWHNFAHTRQAHEMWKIAEAKYSRGDTHTVDKEMAALCGADSSKSKSIKDYINYICRRNGALLRMGKHVDDWILSSILRNGLAASHATHLYHLTVIASRAEKEMTFGEMASTLMMLETMLNGHKRP